MRPRNRISSTAVWVLLVGYSLTIGVPLYLMLLSSLKQTREIYGAPFGFPSSLQFSNFTTAWGQAHFETYTLNSLVITTVSVVLVIVLGLAAAYPLSRYKIAGMGLLLAFFLLGIMLPVRLGVVRLFLLMRDLNLLDTRIGLVLVYVGMRLPFAIFVLVSFMRTVPLEIEEAARVEGASEWQLLRYVFAPLARPAVAIVAIFTAIAVWNDFFFPLIFIYSDSKKTLPLGLTTFMGQYQSNWGLLFAGLTIASIPLVALYLIFSRQTREGIATGGFR